MKKKSQKQENKDNKHNSQSLIKRIHEDNITVIEPVYNPEKGCKNCYPVIEAIVGPDTEIEPLLEEMTESGELIKELFDKNILCPRCNSQYISTRYNCPYCNSFDIEKSSLIEHTKCGYMDIEQNFLQKKTLACPKCNTILKKEDFDYKKAGVWCKCNNCSKNFDIPTPSHFCRKCDTISTFEEVNIKNIYSYRVKDSPKSGSLASEFAYVAINNFLVKEGWKVNSPVNIKGKSGAEYSFDIGAFKGSEKEKPIVFDVTISSDEIIAEQPVVTLFAKIFDVSPKKSVLVAIPKLSNNGKKMAKLYNIQTIEANNKTQVIDRLKEILE